MKPIRKLLKWNMTVRSEYPLQTILKFFLIIFYILIGLTCEKKVAKSPPKNTEKFVEVYTDYIVALRLSPSKPAEAVFDSILQENRFKKQDFQASLAYYAQHPTEWESFIRKVIDQLQVEAAIKTPAAPTSKE